VKGNPGRGKTVLAGATVEELTHTNHDQSECPPAVCYYFFNQNTGQRNSPVDAYRAIVAQLFQQFWMLEKVYNIFALSLGEPELRTKASEHELVEIIRHSVLHLPNLFLVLDGIDECSNSGKLLRELANFCVGSPLKIIIFSRPNVACLRRHIHQQTRILINPEQVSHGIAIYLKQEVMALQQQSLLAKEVDIEDIGQRLVLRAEGMFLWARLMAGYLNSLAMTSSERMETILFSTPEGIDEMYSRIQEKINSLDGPTRSLARRALMWVAYSGSSLSSAQLKEILYPEGWDQDSSNDCGNLDNVIIISSCGLLEKRRSGLYHYIHLTALDYARSSCSGCDFDKSLIPDRFQSKALMSARCISYLAYSVPVQPLNQEPPGPARSNSLFKSLHFLSYSSLEWLGLFFEATVPS
jgi:hypothetical protein